MTLSIGAHMSIAKGYDRAVSDAISIGASAMQVFTRNPRGGKARQVPETEFERARDLASSHGITAIVLHAPYTINLASSREEVRTFAINTLRQDMRRLSALNACAIVVHADAHTGAGHELGERRLKEAIDALLPDVPSGRRLLIETMSGSGSELGHRLDALSALLKDLDAPDLLGLCLDTCHLFAAGYGLASWHEMRAILDNTLDWDTVGACHLNDSLTPQDSRRDRHAVLGGGHIGLPAFADMVRDPKIQALPLILETPQPTLSGWGEEIALLRRFAAQ